MALSTRYVFLTVKQIVCFVKLKISVLNDSQSSVSQPRERDGQLVCSRDTDTSHRACPVLNSAGFRARPWAGLGPCPLPGPVCPG